jgi:lysozyme
MMTNNYTYSNAGLALTKEFEGLRLTPYQDSGGVWTVVGYGHTGPNVHPGMVITQAEADALLVKDVQVAVDAVNRLVTASLNQNQADALIDFTFNLGEGVLARSTLLRLLNAGKYDYAADQFLAWDHAGGVVVPGLLRRRLAEMELFNEEVGK